MEGYRQYRPADTLTARERELAALVCEGCRDQVIADRLVIRPQTVKNHLAHIFDKVGVSSRLELAVYLLTRDTGCGCEDSSQHSSSR